MMQQSPPGGVVGTMSSLKSPSYMYPTSGGAFPGSYPLSGMPSDLMCTKPLSRRTKRMVPVEQKDDRYWEKRKRNNDAARRSRENKRQVEMDMRARVMFLEQDNSLLRKELSIIKAKFGLSAESRYLSVDDNGDLVASAPLDLPYLSMPQPSTSPTIEAGVSLSSMYQNSVSSDENMSAAMPEAEYDTKDDYMPMKKRRRPKMEAEMKASGGSSSTMAQYPTMTQDQYPHTGIEDYYSTRQAEDRVLPDPMPQKRECDSPAVSYPPYSASLPLYPGTLVPSHLANYILPYRDNYHNDYKANHLDSSDMKTPTTRNSSAFGTVLQHNHTLPELKNGLAFPQTADDSTSGYGGSSSGSTDGTRRNSTDSDNYSPTGSEQEQQYGAPTQQKPRGTSEEEKLAADYRRKSVAGDVLRQSSVEYRQLSVGGYEEERMRNLLKDESARGKTDGQTEQEVRRENEVIRSQLQFLSAEVARMKDFVLQKQDRSSASQ